MTWMASAMHGAQTQLETATNNLATVASDGFQRVRSELDLTDHGLVARAQVVATQGGIRETGRPFDLALVGPGAFRVGNRETRDGSFLVDRDGFVADRNGRRLHGLDGPIHASGQATIGADGSVRDGGRVVGRIPLPAGTTVRSGARTSASSIPCAGWE